MNQQDKQSHQSFSGSYYEGRPYPSNNTSENSPPSYFDHVNQPSDSVSFGHPANNFHPTEMFERRGLNHHNDLGDNYGLHRYEYRDVPESLARDNNGVQYSEQNPNYEENKAQFGSPIAHNETWAATEEDYKLISLPKIDFILRVKSRLSRKAGRPFDPAPPSFSRQVPQISKAKLQNFRPLVLQSDSKSGLVGSGFKPAYLGWLFAPLDVSAADYARFLEDIFTAGKVGGTGQIISNVAPLSMHMGVSGYFVTKAITHAFARKNEPIVMETIEVWQERFFAPRGMDVFAVSNGERVTGAQVGGIPPTLSPEIVTLIGANKNTKQSEFLDKNYDQEGHYDNLKGYSSDESLDSHKSRDSQGRKLSKDEKKAWKAHVKMVKKQRKQHSKELKDHQKELKKKKKDEDKKKKHGREKDTPLLVFAPLHSSFAFP